MTESVINSQLIDTLAQVISALTEPERQILLHKLQPHHDSDQGSLQQDIAIGVLQLEAGDYTDYDANSLPNLLSAIKHRGKLRLKPE